MKFTEEKLEKAFTELLGQEGYPDQLGIDIQRKPDEVLIEEDLKKLLTLNQFSKCPVFLLINWTNHLSLHYNKKDENS
ncbi:MAG: hypothetical protein KJZ94_04170 [Ignavibacteria bacterium]|nr:hypothetical protein [Ignavibacteria bacterium]